MVYSKKCALFAVFVTASLVRAADECVDIWIASRCSMQKRKGNCVPEAQCPNPKKDGIKCTRARSKCVATCRLCDEDSTSSCAAEIEELAAQLAEKDAIIASMTSPPPSLPPPLPPPGADYPCDSAYNLLTLTQAYDWCATHCEGRTVKVITGDDKDKDYSDRSGGVCAIGHYTTDMNYWEVDVTLTQHDDCFVLVVDEDSGGDNGFGHYGVGSAKLFGLDGNDVLCGTKRHDFYFYGGDGDDLLAAGPGEDKYMYGDAGADKIFGGKGADMMFDGDSVLYGGEGEDSIYADPGDVAYDNDVPGEKQTCTYDCYIGTYDCCYQS